MKSALWRVAVHEAGHLLAETVLGFYPIYVSLDTEVVGAGHTECRDRQTVRERADDYVLTLLAGAEAERALVGDDALTKAGATSDIMKVNAVLPACSETDFDVHLARAKAFVLRDDNTRAILEIAGVLEKKTKMVGRELQLAIGEARGGLEPELPPTAGQGAGEQILGVVRSLGPVLRQEFVVDELHDALVLGDLSPLLEDSSVSITPQNPDDGSRLESLKNRSDLTIEFLDGSGELVSLRRISANGAGFRLDPFELDF
jgi:hypothetical protein